MKQAQGTQVSSGPQPSLRGLPTKVHLACNRGRSTELLVSARTVDYSHVRASMQARDALSSSMSERFLGDGPPASFWAGMTLAVTGSTGFVVPAQRAVIRSARPSRVPAERLATDTGLTVS